MSSLPLLVVHGFWIWLAVLLVGTAGLAFAMYRLYQARERREIGKQVELRGAIAAGPREGASALRGVLRGGRASTLRYERDGHEASGREPGIWLESNGERVELEGPLHVAAGRHWRHARREFPRGTPSALREARGGATSLALVEDGDEVIVEGDVSLAPDRAEHTHRELAGKWVVRASGRPIRIWAVAPAAPTVVGRWWIAAMIATSLVVTQVGLGWLGKSMLGRQPLDEAGNIRFGFSIAVAIPNTRLKALEKLQLELMMHGVTTIEQDRRVLAVDELRNRIF